MNNGDKIQIKSASGATASKPADPAGEQVKTAEFMLSRDPAKAMQEMMETIDALRRIYVEENAVLGKADTRAFIGLQDRKISLARSYQSGTQQIIARKEEFKNVPPVMKSKLREAHEEFHKLASINLKSIERLKRGVGRLNERVMSAARAAAQQSSVNYGKKGVLGSGERRISIGLNESA
jgi:hypothetical protein